MNKPFVILFAGPVGSSKTPIAYHLSWNRGLPIFNNDAIRSEVVADTLKELDEELQLEIRNKRLEELIKLKKSFILDASIDRTWKEVFQKLEENGFDYFLISIDISKDLLNKLYSARNQDKTNLEKWYQEHQDFLKDNKELVNISINDSNFKDRLQLSLNEVNKLLNK